MQITQIKNILYYTLFLGLAVFLLYFSFRNIQFDDFIKELQLANYWLVLLSVIIGFGAYIFRSLRWQLLIEPLGYKPSFTHTYHALMMGYAANLILPRVGEVTRCVTLNKMTKVPFDSLIGTVVAERIIDVLCLLIAVCLVFFMRIDVFGKFIQSQMLDPLFSSVQNQINNTSTTYLTIGVIIILGLSIFAILILRKKNCGSRFMRVFEGLSKGLKSIFKLKHNILFIAYTIAIWICFLLTSYFIAIALPGTANFNLIDALFLMAIGALAWVVPVPGGMGAFHYFVSLALGVYGVPAEPDGIVFATIAHESQVIPMALLGVISFIFFSAMQKKNI